MPPPGRGSTDKENGQGVRAELFFLVLRRELDVPYLEGQHRHFHLIFLLILDDELLCHDHFLVDQQDVLVRGKALQDQLAGTKAHVLGEPALGVDVEEEGLGLLDAHRHANVPRRVGVPEDGFGPAALVQPIGKDDVGVGLPVIVLRQVLGGKHADLYDPAHLDGRLVVKLVGPDLSANG